MEARARHHHRDRRGNTADEFDYERSTNSKGRTVTYPRIDKQQLTPKAERIRQAIEQIRLGPILGKL